MENFDSLNLDESLAKLIFGKFGFNKFGWKFGRNDFWQIWQSKIFWKSKEWLSKTADDKSLVESKEIIVKVWTMVVGGDVIVHLLTTSW